MCDGFHTRSDRLSYLLRCEDAEAIRRDPAVLEAGRQHLERFAARDPRQRAGYELWCTLFDQGPEAVVSALTECSERGDYARQTAPVFQVVPDDRRRELVSLARQPLPFAKSSG